MLPRLRRIIKPAVLGLLAVGVLWAVSFYAADGVVEADVKGKRCSAVGPSELTVVTRALGTVHREALGFAECSAVPLGAFVEYRVRSGHTVVYDREDGRCIFDSVGKVC